MMQWMVVLVLRIFCEFEEVLPVVLVPHFSQLSQPGQKIKKRKKFISTQCSQWINIYLSVYIFYKIS